MKRTKYLGITLVAVTALLVSGCSTSMDDFTTLRSVAKSVDFGAKAKVISSAEFGSSSSIEGDPPTIEYLLQNKSGLQRELDTAFEASGFDSAGLETWQRRSEGVVVLAQIGFREANSEYVAQDAAPVRVPSTGGIVVRMSVSK